MDDIGRDPDLESLYRLDRGKRPLIFALHEAVEELDTFLVSDANEIKMRLIKTILARHIEGVLYQMNEPVLSGEGMLRHTRFEKIDSAPQEEREHQVMEVYFNKICLQ